MSDDWSHEEADDPLYADQRNFYKVEKWSRDGQRGKMKILCRHTAILLNERLSEAVALQQVHNAGYCHMSRCADAEIMLVSEKGCRSLKEPKPFQVSALSRNTKSVRNAMTELLALSVSVAVLGGIWAFIALGPLGGGDHV